MAYKAIEKISLSIWRLNMVLNPHSQQNSFHCLLYTDLCMLKYFEWKDFKIISVLFLYAWKSVINFLWFPLHRNRISQVKSCNFSSKYRQIVIMKAVFHSGTSLNNKMSRKEKGQRCKEIQRFLALSLNSKH